ncbi:aldo/keto reductase [Singulisphaera rosea]
MNEFNTPELDRRGFLKTGAIATATPLALASLGHAAPDSAKRPTLPVRPLGKTGVKVSILNLGTWKSPGVDRLLRFGYANGIRYYDTADCYGSEPAIASWFQAMPEVRKEIFLVTKDHPRSPGEMIPMLDKRLAALKTDSIDLFFIHGLGDQHGVDGAINLLKSPEFKETADAIRKSGKARFIGFSTHHRGRAQIIQAAADVGIVDAIMLQHTPWLEKDSDMNKALDACWNKGIGLVSMKQVAGHGELDELVKRAPGLKEKGLTPYQGLLHAIWTDERISSCCVSMRNTDQIRENSLAAKNFAPMNQAQIRELRDACLASRPTFCADCDGRCGRAGGTDASLGDLARLITYHDHYGYRGEARRLYSQLSMTDRDWKGADLDAAREACPHHLDFATLLERVERHLA